MSQLSNKKQSSAKGESSQGTNPLKGDKGLVQQVKKSKGEETDTRKSQITKVEKKESEKE